MSVDKLVSKGANAPLLPFSQFELMLDVVIHVVWLQFCHFLLK